MMRYIIVFFMCLFVNSIFAQKECEGGDKDPFPNPLRQQDPLDGTETSGGISADPNEIIGPTGYDSVHWVSVNDVLNYTILFENDPEFATANAQKVDVRFKFEEKALIKGFGLEMYGFANMSWPIEGAPAAYQNRLDLRDSMHIYVDLVAGVDVVEQEAFWTFNSIDPLTGWNPWQVDRGMLPVNDSTHVGEGFLKFQLKPHQNMKTGDTISIAANIVFDQNDTIPTNRWCVTIDAGMPTSKVKGRRDSKNKNLYHLTLQASDDKGGSGLKRVVLYQVNNFGVYEEFAVCPLDTVIDFEAESGRQYSFFSLAEDNVGNIESLKERADLVLNDNVAPTDIMLSDTIFQDDIMQEGFIAEITSVDVDGTIYTYELAEGDGAVHNDLFLIKGTQLLAKNTFKCAEEKEYSIRIGVTDEGGLSFSKSFTLILKNVLERPKPDTLAISICEGDVFQFKGETYKDPGTYYHTVSNTYLCDSVYVLQLTVLPPLEAPVVTIEGDFTLVSSIAKGNQWFAIDGKSIEGAIEQKFTPTEEGIYYVCASNGACYSEPSNAYQVKFSTKTDLTLELKKGWNWISSNLADEKWQNALDFLNPIIDRVEILVDKDSENYDEEGYGIVGNIGTIASDEAYKIYMNDSVRNVWSGTAFMPTEKPITLTLGWNWIGYIPICSNSIDKALANVVPVKNDVIKNLTDFAIYDGSKWVGTLIEMKPGEGYLYYSNAATKFTYTPSNVFIASEYSASKIKSSERYSIPWSVDVHKYPDNMNIIADLYVDEKLATEGLFIVGAFVGEECVGIGEYVDGKLFFTIHGVEGSDVSIEFKAINNNTRNECSIVETLNFENVVHGNIIKPYKLTISETTVIEDIVISGYNIYPKPLRNRMYINGPIEKLMNISIISMNGVVVLNTANYDMNGVDVSLIAPGTYVLVLTTIDGTFVDKVIKAD